MAEGRALINRRPVSQLHSSEASQPAATLLFWRLDLDVGIDLFGIAVEQALPEQEVRDDEDGDYANHHGDDGARTTAGLDYRRFIISHWTIPSGCCSVTDVAAMQFRPLSARKHGSASSPEMGHWFRAKDRNKTRSRRSHANPTNNLGYQGDFIWRQGL
jgi:hypothetical protein